MFLLTTRVTPNVWVYFPIPMNSHDIASLGFYNSSQNSDNYLTYSYLIILKDKNKQPDEQEYGANSGRGLCTGDQSLWIGGTPSSQVGEVSTNPEALQTSSIKSFSGGFIR